MAEIERDSQATQVLMEQAAAGDPQACERLLRRHRSKLVDFVDAHLDPILRTRLDASDVVQEAQIEAARRLPDSLSRRPMPFRVWLRKTAYERLLMLRRQHDQAARRSVRREVQLPDRSSLVLAQNLVDPAGTPSSRLGKQELARRMQEALDRLAGADREVLLMRHYEELSYEEIGCILDIEPATARKRAGRALVRLHKILAQMNERIVGTPVRRRDRRARPVSGIVPPRRRGPAPNGTRAGLEGIASGRRLVTRRT
jgi:RNA polymerase sigma-70 factor (ECF subfamily)